MSHYTGWPEQQTYPAIEGAVRFMNDWIEGYGDPDEALRAAGLGK